jgi:hypothetical protein
MDHVSILLASSAVQPVSVQLAATAVKTTLAMPPAALKTLREPVPQPPHLHPSAVVLLPRLVQLQRLLRRVEVRVLDPHRLPPALRALQLLRVLLLVIPILGSRTLSPMPQAALSLLP